MHRRPKGDSVTWSYLCTSAKEVPRTHGSGQDGVTLLQELVSDINVLIDHHVLWSSEGSRNRVGIFPVNAIRADAEDERGSNEKFPRSLFTVKILKETVLSMRTREAHGLHDFSSEAHWGRLGDVARGIANYHMRQGPNQGRIGADAFIMMRHWSPASQQMDDGMDSS